jgi:hypothetical protein
LAGQSSCYPSWWPIYRWGDLTEEQFKNLIASKSIIFEDAAKILRQKYQISSWFAVNQHAKVPLEDWIGWGGDDFYKKYGWPEVIKKAIALEVEDINREIEKQRNEQRMQIKEQSKPVFEALHGIAKNSAIEKTFR